MHMIHDIATYADQENGVLNVVIDIPAGSNNKYEYDHDLGCFTLDRVVHHSMFYPFNYGFLPQTLSKDGDPCDVCLYTTNPLFTGCVVKARPIGILYTSDDAGDDPKIIAVPISKVDPRRDEVKTIEDLGAHKKEELESNPMNFCDTFQNTHDRSSDCTCSLLQRYHQYPLTNTSRNE